MNVTAVFAGKDGWLGYRAGRTYRLTIEEGSAMQGEYPLYIVSPYPCPYASFEAFLRNWTLIRLSHGPESSHSDETGARSPTDSPPT